MDKKAICLGELLIDFVSTLNGVTLRDAPGFEKAPGGAPANVAVGLSKLGIETYFIGKIGKDAFGDFLRMTLDKYGVKTNYLTTTTKAKTTLAFVSLTEEGERDFVFLPRSRSRHAFGPIGYYRFDIFWKRCFSFWINYYDSRTIQ